MATDPGFKPQDKPRPTTEGYEKRDANAKWIFGIVSGLAVALVISHFAIAWMMNALEKTTPPADPWTSGQRAERMPAARPPLPRLQVSPPRDWMEYRAREEVQLHTYGWVNRTAGVVRIPIERAMELVLERGLPERMGTNQSRLGPTPLELQQQRTNYTEQEIQLRR